MSPEKIEAIKKYLSKNGVKYYDVQAELIDHFATAVEKAQREQPGIPFTSALLAAHRAFGGREGFHKYIEAAERKVQKKITYLVGKTLLGYLKWPYLLFTLTLLFSWRLGVEHLTDFTTPVYGFMLVFVFVVLFLSWRVRKEHMLLPKRASESLGWVFYFSYYLLGTPYIFREPESLQAINPWFHTAVFTFFTLLPIACLQLPRLTVAETRKLYPEMS